MSAARRRRAAKTLCCGPPVPAKTPKDGMCREPAECAEAMKVLGDSNRLKIIRALTGGPLNVGEICRKTGLVQHRVSHHLGRMRPAGLVECMREGRKVVYRINPRIATRWGLDFGCCYIMFREL